MRVACHQPNFMPWSGFFAKAAAADVFVLLDDVQFSKGSYTNRTRMAGGKWRTVPVNCHACRPVKTTKPPGMGTMNWMPLTSTDHGEPVMASLLIVGVLASKLVNDPGWLIQ